MKFWPWWNRPISRRWLGAHKTVVGFGFGVVSGVLVACVQSRLPWSATGAPDWVLAGVAQSIGAMTGDSVKSLVKRRVGIAPGQRWIPADQLDFVLGALLLAWRWLTLPR